MRDENKITINKIKGEYYEKVTEQVLEYGFYPEEIGRYYRTTYKT